MQQGQGVPSSLAVPAAPGDVGAMSDVSLRVFTNPRRGVPGLVVLPAGGFRRAQAAITAWPGYAPTPLHQLPDLARQLRVGCIQVKDEATRFGLGSVKALGGAYAVEGVVASAEAQGKGPITVTCATDGNHGRSVAWGAQRCGVSALVLVHPGVSPARRAAIAAFGATVREVPGSYDDAVRASAAVPDAQVVSDTSWPGYIEIPREIMQGYRLMPDEALDQWTGPPPTHVFIQAGVGGIAAAVSVQLRARGIEAALIIVEPDGAACLYASAVAGQLTVVPGPHETLMAGLACGTPSLLAWRELERAAAAFVTIPDTATVAAMRALAGSGVISGETGAAGLGALLLAAKGGMLSLTPDSRVLLFSCEGATDPARYASLIA